jgi:protein-S-isoprenylcysteine O-methyltransferase Ste14
MRWAARSENREAAMALSSDDTLVWRMVRQLVIYLAITGAVLFASAGTINWPQAWFFLAELGIIGLVSGIGIARHDPQLMRERMRGPIQREQKAWDKALLTVVFVLFAALHVIAGLDAVRFHTSNMPVWLNVVGALGIAVGLYGFHVVLRENSYATAVVRVQSERGHQVISTGPYALVRHPMYAAAIFYFVGTALLLGSWYAVAISLVLVGLFGLRAVWEEQTLVNELPGYSAYAQRVRYRLVPGIW